MVKAFGACLRCAAEQYLAQKFFFKSMPLYKLAT
jgi:hypothetical protein